MVSNTGEEFQICSL